MLMKTAYVGPDTAMEKAVACVLVLLGAFVFAVIMGMVVQVIKSVESKGAELRGVLQQAALFNLSRDVPKRLAKLHTTFQERQWWRTNGLETQTVLHGLLKLPTHLHDSVLVAVFEELIPMCPILQAASNCPGGLNGSLPPLLRLLQPQVVLQKAIVHQTGTPCTELYILIKGTLQAELSVTVRHELDVKHGDTPHRRGGVGLGLGAQDCASILTSAPADGESEPKTAAALLAEMVTADMASQPDSYREKSSCARDGSLEGESYTSSTAPTTAQPPPSSPPSPSSPEYCRSGAVSTAAAATATVAASIPAAVEHDGCLGARAALPAAVVPPEAMLPAVGMPPSTANLPPSAGAGKLPLHHRHHRPACAHSPPPSPPESESESRGSFSGAQVTDLTPATLAPPPPHNRSLTRPPHP